LTAITLRHMAGEDGVRERAKVAQEAAARIKLVAGARRPGENTKARIARTAIELGWAYGRVHDIWYKIARRVEVFEMDRLRALTRGIHRLSPGKEVENSNFD
jgi:hypothetical protein